MECDIKFRFVLRAVGADRRSKAFLFVLGKEPYAAVTLRSVL
jgi:hypothetical protein